MGKDFGKGKIPWAPLGESEKEFLLACIQSDKQVLPAISSVFDWQTFTSRANLDGIGALVYKHLCQATEIPTPSQAELKYSYYQNVAANNIRLNELRRLGKLLAKNNIPLLVLKGAALALTVYADPAYRFMGDLDIAVPPKQSQEALELLLQDGYILHKEDNLAQNQTSSLLREKGWHLRLTKTVHAQKVEIEFHWPLRQIILVEQVVQLNVAHLWQTAIPLELENNLLQPSHAMMLLHLCIHTGVQHRFNELGIRHYIDIDRFVRHFLNDDMWWQSFVRDAKQAHASHVSYFCLQITQSLLNTPIPTLVLEQLQPSQWQLFLFKKYITTNDIINRTRALHEWYKIIWRLLTTDQIYIFIKIGWQILFPGRDYLIDYYNQPNPLFMWLYTLWHPYHTLKKAFRRRLHNFIKLSKQYIPINND